MKNFVKSFSQVLNEREYTMTQSEFEEKMEELKSILNMAANKAEQLARSSDLSDFAVGTEGEEISILLADVWNGFMTGDREDTSHESMIFKF
jgi:cell shape-determining protein MreC